MSHPRATTLSPAQNADFLQRLEIADQPLRGHDESGPSDRQPIHTVYGGAHLFRADIAERLGATARKVLVDYAPSASALAQALAPRQEPATTQSSDEKCLDAELYQRVVDKLAKEPVEDYRIDFEDGFGPRSDEEEDATAIAAAKEVARGLRGRSLPPYLGIRIKSLASRPVAVRALRTLDRFLTALLEESAGMLPPWFAVTLPKITHPEQVAVCSAALASIEAAARLPTATLKLELMIETPESLFGNTHPGDPSSGGLALPAFVAAAQRGGGRTPVAVHFGAYDYTAACGITALDQTLDHPACDFARNLMQVALAGTGIWLSDGATNVLPIAPHRGEALRADQLQENRDAVHRAFRTSYANIRRALRSGYYQGWDLHPAQLPIRYAATYAGFREGLAQTAERLKNFLQKAAQATRVGTSFDDAATARGLINHFVKAHGCGALTAEEIRHHTSLPIERLKAQSLAQLLASE